MAFVAATVLGLMVVAELIAYLGLAWIEGGWLLPRPRVAEQRALIQTGAPATVDGLTGADMPPASNLPLVLHPFAGFLRDPAKPNAFYQVAEDGFFAPRVISPDLARPGTASSSRSEERALVVALFGGSVANHVALSGAPVLTREIERATGRTVAVRSLALGGFKQPQQLTTLAYAQARGTRFDVIVNLDGFNELVLPFDNLRADVEPTYPIHWPSLAGGLRTMDAHRQVGEIAFLKARRSDRAARAAGPIRRYCGICQLAWRVADRRLGQRLAEIQGALTVQSATGRRFQSHGPAIESRDRDARLHANVALWARASHQMDALARSMGSHYLHVLQPNQYLAGSKPLSTDERVNAYDPSIHHRTIVEQGYPMMIEAGATLRDQGVDFHDLTGLFREQAATRYVDHCCHLNRRGNVEIARAIAERIVDALERGRESRPSLD